MTETDMFCGSGWEARAEGFQTGTRTNRLLGGQTLKEQQTARQPRAERLGTGLASSAFHSSPLPHLSSRTQVRLLSKNLVCFGSN